MKISKFIVLYPQKGKTAISDKINKSGVYLIKFKGRLIYVGFSENNLYRTIVRHFEKWNDKQRKRIVYPQTSNFTVRIVLTTPKRAAILERALIIKYKPKDNSNKYDSFSQTKTEKEILQQYLKDSPF